MSLGSFKNVLNKMFLQIIIFNIYVLRGFGNNNQQWLICYKTKLNQPNW